MMLYVAAYLIALISFAVIDIAWLSSVGAQLYKATLGDILATEIRVPPAIVFYLIFPVGLLYFAIDPAIKQGSLSTAVVNGALFGFFTYATYELTNFATLRNWTLGITVVDIAYGAIVSATVAGLTYKVAPAVARWTGA